MSEVQLFPPYKQAVQDFLQQFKYGDLVTHEWLEAHFGMLTIDDGQRLTASAFRDRQFAWLASVEAFKSDLLRDHQVCLQSVRGKGYRWLPPGEQTGTATKEFEKDAKRVFRIVGQKLANVRVSELTDEQRRENVEAAAKISQLRGMSVKLLRG